MVVWATHGSAGGASHVFDNTLTSHLDDTKPAQAFQASCLNGYPENANNLGYALLREGAIGTICASRVSWEGFGAWTFDPTSGQNHNLAYYYTDKLVLGGHTAGAALYLTKGNVPTVGMNLIDYNLYGDPGCVFLSTLPNLPPVADANGPYTADEGTPILFDGSGSSDPEGDALEYRWDVDNDATWDTAWSTDPTASHAWGDDRLGAARLEVRDQLGFTDEATAAVQVNNVAPSVTLDALAQPNPQFILPVVHTLGFTGSFTDPGWLDTHVGEWDFGDGPAVPGDLTEENAEPDATGVVTGGHVYASPGVYVVELTVTDDDGGSGADTMEITVVDEFGALQDIHDYIQGQPNSVFAGPAARRRRTLCRKLGPVRKMLVTQAYRGAIHNLLNNIRAKADGGVDGKAAGDWIVDVDVQKELCMKIDDLVAYLEYLLAL
jgi:hypothetical protein